jgi:hypothetical protein
MKFSSSIPRKKLTLWRFYAYKKRHASANIGPHNEALVFHIIFQASIILIRNATVDESGWPIIPEKRANRDSSLMPAPLGYFAGICPDVILIRGTPDK